MSKEMLFYYCPICKNLMGAIHHPGPVPVCCGKPMEALVAGSVDAAKEKHIPVVTHENGKLIVTVGSVEHPMTEPHYIQWIAVTNGVYTQRIALTPVDAPRAEFTDIGEATVYAYCNLHGLWKA